MVEYKFNEDKSLDEAKEYITSTYKQHYVNRRNNDQTVDVWDQLGSAETTCRDTALKYLMRYGKKGGKNRKDLLKAIHYIVLMMYFQQRDEPTFKPVTSFEQNDTELERILKDAVFVPHITTRDPDILAQTMSATHD